MVAIIFKARTFPVSQPKAALLAHVELLELLELLEFLN